MKHILVYADSLSWGIIPDSRQRQPFNHRWPGVLENALKARGHNVRITEDCLNGRRTVWDDPFKLGRNGIKGLAQAVECHSPLALVILMLGTNDFQSMHPHNAWHSAQGIASLVNEIHHAPIEAGMPVPAVLVVVPPEIDKPKGAIAEKFFGADEKCKGLAEAYHEATTRLECACFNAAEVVSSSRVDGVHLDGEDHIKLGNALCDVVLPLI